MLIRGFFRHQYVLKYKNVSNWSERGGQHFSNKSQIQKSLKYPIGGGGGGQAYLGLCPKFSRFLIMMPPLSLSLLTFQFFSDLCFWRYAHIKTNWVKNQTKTIYSIQNRFWDTRYDSTFSGVGWGWMGVGQ